MEQGRLKAYVKSSKTTPLKHTLHQRKEYEIIWLSYRIHDESDLQPGAANQELLMN